MTQSSKGLMVTYSLGFSVWASDSLGFDSLGFSVWAFQSGLLVWASESLGFSVWASDSLGF